MTTKILGPFAPNPDPTVGPIEVENPFQGQGTNDWKALVRNITPYALVVIAGASQSWLAPFEQDLYEFPGAINRFYLDVQTLGNVPGGNSSSAGSILVTAFDQSSSYDGTFPTSISQPQLQQTFSLLGEGTLDSTQLSISGVLAQSFDAVVCIAKVDATLTPPTTGWSPSVFMRLTVDATDGVTDFGGYTDSKGRFSPGRANFSVPGGGTRWTFAVIGKPGTFTSHNITVPFQIYGVTIADATALLGPPDGLILFLDPTDDAVESRYVEFDPVGPLGTWITMQYTYDGNDPGAGVQVIVYTDDGTEPPAGGSQQAISRIVLDLSGTTSVASEVRIPAHKAWTMEVRQNGDTDLVHFFGNIALLI